MSQHVIIEINGDSYLCKDLKTAQALLTSLANAELQPMCRRWLHGISENSTLVKDGTFHASLNIGMSARKNIDLDWEEIVNHEAMDEYPPVEHDDIAAE